MERPNPIFLPEAALLSLQDTPCYVYDENGLRHTARELTRAFSWSRGYRQFFAVKAAPNPQVLRILREEGQGAMCTTRAELLLAERCGFSKDQIVFAGCFPHAEDFAEAERLGAEIIFDDLAQLERYVRCWRLPETVDLRYNAGGRMTAGRRMLANPEISKFGMPKKALFQAVVLLLNRGVRRIGLHAQYASNQTDSAYFAALAQELFSLALEIQVYFNLTVAYCDLSGGLGIPQTGRPDAALGAAAEAIRGCFERYMRAAALGKVPVRTQFGRFVVGANGILVSRVLYKKESYRSYVAVNASSAQLMRTMLLDAQYPVTFFPQREDAERKLQIVVGSAADVLDKLTDKRFFPEPEVGDLCVFHNTGAYAAGLGNHHCGRLRAAEYLYTAQGTLRLVRHAETVEDYFQGFLWESPE